MAKQNGNSKIHCDKSPSIRMETIYKKVNASHLERLSIATKRRYFTLCEDWFIEVNDIKYKPELNGTIKIPYKEDKKENVFDGASIPIPWLISLLTIGILRPLGVMLLASIIHDYAYEYGYLWVSHSDNKYKKVKLDRYSADLLLKDTISELNGLPVVGYIAWFFVRIGWVWVKYNQETRKGKKPYFEYAVLITVILLFMKLGLEFTFTAIFSGLFIIYFIFYFFTIIYNLRH